MKLNRVGIPFIFSKTLEQLVNQLNIIFTSLRDFLNRVVDSNNEFDDKMSCFNTYIREKQVKTLSMRVENFGIDVSKLDNLYMIFQLDETSNILRVYIRRSDGIVKVGSIPLA